MYTRTIPWRCGCLPAEFRARYLNNGVAQRITFGHAYKKYVRDSYARLFTPHYLLLFIRVFSSHLWHCCDRSRNCTFVRREGIWRRGYTGCHRRNGPNFGRVFLMLNYTDITQNTYIQSWTVTEIMAREKYGHLAFPRNVRLQLCSALTVRLWRHKLRPTR